MKNWNINPEPVRKTGVSERFWKIMMAAPVGFLAGWVICLALIGSSQPQQPIPSSPVISEPAASTSVSSTTPATPVPEFSPSTPASSSTYVGPRGGVYHYSASGNKVYQSSSSGRRR